MCTGRILEFYKNGDTDMGFNKGETKYVRLVDSVGVSVVVSYEDMENLLIDFYTGKRIFNIFETKNVLSHLIQGRVVRGEIDSAVGGLHCQAGHKKNI